MKIGRLPGTFCDRHSDKLLDAALMEVAMVPGGFNLFSATKRLRAGWKLGGDDDAVWIAKDGHKTVFDIQIDTAQGAPFCACFKR